MQASISSKQFTEWMAFYQLEPFGDERDDLRMARLATVISNTIVSAWTGKDGPFTEEDMLFQFDAESIDAEEIDPDQVAAKMREAISTHGITPLAKVP